MRDRVLVIFGQETNKQNTQLQESMAEMQQRLREQESLYVSRLAASENERRRLEQQVSAPHAATCDNCRVTVWQLHELEAACERERGGTQELLAKHEAVCRCVHTHTQYTLTVCAAVRVQ